MVTLNEPMGLKYVLGFAQASREFEDWFYLKVFLPNTIELATMEHLELALSSSIHKVFVVCIVCPSY